MSRIVSAQTRRPVYPAPFVLNLSFSQTVKFETSVHSRRGQELSVLSKGNSSHQTCMVYNKKGKSKVKYLLLPQSQHHMTCKETTFKKSISPPPPYLWSWGPQTTVCRCRHGCQILQQPGRYHSGQTQGTSPETQNKQMDENQKHKRLMVSRSEETQPRQHCAECNNVLIRAIYLLLVSFIRLILYVILVMKSLKCFHLQSKVKSSIPLSCLYIKNKTRARGLA